MKTDSDAVNCIQKDRQWCSILYTERQNILHLCSKDVIQYKQTERQEDKRNAHRYCLPSVLHTNIHLFFLKTHICEIKTRKKRPEIKRVDGKRNFGTGLLPRWLIYIQKEVGRKREVGSGRVIRFCTNIIMKKWTQLKDHDSFVVIGSSPATLPSASRGKPVVSSTKRRKNKREGRMAPCLWRGCMLYAMCMCINPPPPLPPPPQRRVMYHSK